MLFFYGSGSSHSGRGKCMAGSLMLEKANRSNANEIIARQKTQTPDQPSTRHAHAPRNDPTDAANKIADHVKHVQAASRLAVQAVDSRLIRNVPRLNSQIECEDAQDQADERFSRSGPAE